MSLRCKLGFHDLKEIYRFENEWPTHLLFPWVPTGMSVCKRCGLKVIESYSSGEEDVGQ